MNDFGKRTRMILTRAGWIDEVFYVCYVCPSAELTEAELSEHTHEEFN